MFKVVFIYFILIIQVYCHLNDIFRNNWRNAVGWSNNNNLINYSRQPWKPSSALSSPNYGPISTPSNFYLPVRQSSSSTTTTMEPVTTSMPTSTTTTVEPSSTTIVPSSTRVEPSSTTVVPSSSTVEPSSTTQIPSNRPSWAPQSESWTQPSGIWSQWSQQLGYIPQQFGLVSPQFGSRPQQPISWIQQNGQFPQFAGQFPQTSNTWSQFNSKPYQLNPSLQQSDFNLFKNVWQQSSLNTVLGLLQQKTMVENQNTTTMPSVINTTSVSTVQTNDSNDKEQSLNTTETDITSTTPVTTELSSTMISTVVTPVVNNSNSQQNQSTTDLQSILLEKLQHLRQYFQLPIFGNQQLQDPNPQFLPQIQTSAAQINNYPPFIPQNNNQYLSNGNGGNSYPPVWNTGGNVPAPVGSNIWNSNNPWNRQK